MVGIVSSAYAILNLSQSFEFSAPSHWPDAGCAWRLLTGIYCVKALLHVAASSGIGGAENHLIDLAVGQLREGLEVAVACPDRGELARSLRQRGISVYPWAASSRYNPLTGLALRRLFNRLKPTLVHAHMSKAAWLCGHAARGLGLPVVATAHTLVKGAHFSRCEAVICVSQAVLDSLLRQGYPRNRSRLIHNTVELTRFRPDLARPEILSELGLAPGEEVCTFIQVGRLEPVKNHEATLEAMGMVVGSGLACRLLVIGDGTLRANLERRAQTLGLTDKVHFLGFRADVEHLLALADVFLMPSLKEGLPLALLEAMACGVVPVAARVGGIPEVIEDGLGGILIAPGDINELAQAMLKLGRDKALRAAMAARSRETVISKHDPASQRQAVAAVYGLVSRIGS